MSAQGFFTYYRDTLLRPRIAFQNLMKDNRMLRYGFYAVGITATVYSMVYVFLIIGDGRPFKPWLDIAPEAYYRWNVFFCAPVMFLAWILSSAVMHLLSRSSNPQVSFEHMLAVGGFGLSMASWATAFHDLITSFLGATDVISQNAYEHAMNTPGVVRTQLWVQMILYVVLFIVFFSRGVSVVYRTGKLRSFLTGLLGFVVYQGFFFIFNR